MGGKRWNFFHVSLVEGNSMQNHPSSQDHAGFQQMRAAGFRPVRRELITPTPSGIVLQLTL
jgi:hypothetical protein